MDRVTKFKEAVKTALALVLVYGIALKVGWMIKSTLELFMTPLLFTQANSLICDSW
jgi:hypothetical protein